MRVNEVVLSEGTKLDEFLGIGNWMAYRSGKRDLRATVKNLTREFNTWKGRQGIARTEKPSYDDIVNFFRFKKVSPKVIKVIEPNLVYDNRVIGNIMKYMAALTLSGGQPVRPPAVAGTGIRTDSDKIIASAQGGGAKKKKKSNTPAQPTPQPTPTQGSTNNKPFVSSRNQPKFSSRRSTSGTPPSSGAGGAPSGLS